MASDERVTAEALDVARVAALLPGYLLDAAIVRLRRAVRDVASNCYSLDDSWLLAFASALLTKEAERDALAAEVAHEQVKVALLSTALRDFGHVVKAWRMMQAATDDLNRAIDDLFGRALDASVLTQEGQDGK